jgi:hypothetical protein
LFSIDIDKTDASIPIFIIVIGVMDYNTVCRSSFKVLHRHVNCAIIVVCLGWGDDVLIDEQPLHLLPLEIDSKFVMRVGVLVGFKRDVGKPIVMCSLVQSQMRAIIDTVFLDETGSAFGVASAETWKIEPEDVMECPR